MTTYADKFLKAMTPEQRKALGKSGQTREEGLAKYEAGRERELQKHMSNLLRQRGLMFFSPPMTRRSAMPAGWPDFTILLKGGRVLFVEAKTEGGLVSAEQEDWHQSYRFATEAHVYVVRNLTEFKSILEHAAKSGEGE